MAIELPAETRKALVAAVQHYFLVERGDEVGDLQASFFLDFVLKEIGPSVYNQGVRDAQAHLQTVVGDLDGTLFEPEFGHTAERRPRRAR